MKVHNSKHAKLILCSNKILPPFYIIQPPNFMLPNKRAMPFISYLSAFALFLLLTLTTVTAQNDQSKQFKFLYRTFFVTLQNLRERESETRHIICSSNI